jgi:hypothetical protein
MCLNSLGNAMFAVGEYADAEATFERAAAIWERALGPDHPDVATALGNLAMVRRARLAQRSAGSL